MPFQLGFIGAGNMAGAIIRAAVDATVLSPDDIIAADPYQDQRDALAHLGIVTTDENHEAIQQASQIMLAVKPQMFPKVTDDLRAHLRDEQIVISIMAGIRSDRLCEAVGRPVRVVRVMPNTPVQVGAGMAGVALGTDAQPGDDDLTMRLFSAAGRAIRVEESAIDAVTAVSGSGPAYVFYLAEAMTRAARELGLGDEAPTFVRQTILGAARLMEAQPDIDPAELRRRVTSPGGTTAAAIGHMESKGMAQVIEAAVEAAHARSIELGG